MEYLCQVIKKEGIEFGDEITFQIQAEKSTKCVSGKFAGADAMGIKLENGDYFTHDVIDSTTLEKISD